MNRLRLILIQWWKESKNGYKYKEHPLSEVALVEAHIENENERLLNPIYREIYIELQKELDLYHQEKKKKINREKN